MLEFKEWPPTEDLPRLERYALCQQLYEGHHEVAFADRSAKKPPNVVKKTYIKAGFPKLITKVSADLLFGEPVVFSLADHQDQVNRIVENNNLQATLYETAVSASFRGDAVLRVRLGEIDGVEQAIIEELPAHSYFVEKHKDNCRHVTSEAIAWEVEVGDLVYLRVQRHTAGLVEELAYLLETEEGAQDKVKRVADLEEIYPAEEVPPTRWDSKVPFSLLIHIPNYRHGSQREGETDYSPELQSLFDSVNNRKTRIHETLDKFAKPLLALPEGGLDGEGDVDSASLDCLEVPLEAAQAGLPKHVTWDATMENQFKELDVLEEDIFKFAEIAMGVFGIDNSGSIESARAMRLRLVRTLAMINRKKLYMAPAVRRAVWMAMMLEAAHLPGEKHPVPKRKPDLIWSDGLPQDQKEQAEIEQLRVASKTTSLLSAIMRLDQIGEAAAIIEMERMLAELKRMAPAPTPAPPEPNEEGGPPEDGSSS